MINFTGYSGELCEIRNICKQPSTIPCYNNGTCLVSAENQQHCECAIGFSGDNCELSLRISSNQSSAGRSNLNYIIIVIIIMMTFVLTI